MNELLDQVGDDENHKLAVLLDTVTTLVAEYEREQVVIPKGSPSDVLRGNRFSISREFNAKQNYRLQLHLRLARAIASLAQLLLGRLHREALEYRPQCLL